MKKIIFVSAAALASFISVQAASGCGSSTKDDHGKQERKEIKREKKQERSIFRNQDGEVAYQSKEEFYKDFGNQPNVVWVKTKAFDEATFLNEGVPATAYYNIDSKLVGTSSVKTFEELPAAAQKKINKDYKDYAINKVIFFDDNEYNETDMLMFGSQFNGEDNFFVELQKDNKKIVVQVTTCGMVEYFTALQ